MENSTALLYQDVAGVLFAARTREDALSCLDFALPFEFLGYLDVTVLSSFARLDLKQKGYVVIGERGGRLLIMLH